MTNKLQVQQPNSILKDPKNTEQKLSNYSEVVRDIITDFFDVSLRAPLDDKRLSKTVTSWMTHFIDAGIPASRLWEVYSATLKKNPEYFAAPAMLETWEELKFQEVVSTDDPCIICKGTKLAMRMDLRTGEDVEVPCVCAAFIGK